MGFVPCRSLSYGHTNALDGLKTPNETIAVFVEAYARNHQWSTNGEARILVTIPLTLHAQLVVEEDAQSAIARMKKVIEYENSWML